MMDKIYIRDLMLRCIIGIYPEERKVKQDVAINILLEGSFAKAARTDDIEHAINYETVTKKIIKLVENSDYFLIETMAEKIAALCLEDKKIKRVTVTVDKPGALCFARSVAVEIVRTKLR